MRFREEAVSLDLAILRARCPRTPAVSAAEDPMRDVLVNLVIDRPTLADRDSRVTGPPISADPVSPATAQQISDDPGNRAIAPETLADPVSPVIGPGDIGRPGRPGGDHIQNLPSRIADRGQWQDWRQENLGNIGDYWQDNWGDFDDWYGDSWWNDNHIDYPYYPGFGFWAGAAWAGLTDWVDYGWTDPVYYNYGENVYYDDGSVYYGDQPVCTESNTLTRPRQLR